MIRLATAPKIATASGTLTLFHLETDRIP